MVVPLNERPRSGPYSGINARSAKRFLTQQFRQAGFVCGEEDARDIVLAVTGYTLSDLVLHGTEFLSPEQFEQIKLFADRRMSGEPVDSILGYRDFFGRPFKVSKDVLSPRGDTENLVHQGLEVISSIEHPRILDLGTGSGAIIITLLAERPKSKGVAVDISQKAIDIAQQNALQHNVLERLDFRVGDWFSPVQGQFDLIISNPPYITDAVMTELSRDVLDYDPSLALRGGAEGLDPYKVIIPQARDHLKPAGWVWVEIGYDQGQAVMSLLKTYGYQNISLKTDLSGHDRCVGGQFCP